MIEFVQSIAPWLGYAWMLLGAILLLAMFALLVLDRVFAAVKRAHGLSAIFEAMREWHKAHPEKSRRLRGDDA